MLPDYDIAQALPEREIIGVGEGKHQCFGYGCLDPQSRRLYTFWRAGTSHGVVGAGQIRMRRYDNGGAFPIETYTTVLQPEVGRDLRDPSPCIDPDTGKLVLVFTDTPSSGSGTTYFKAMTFDLATETWSSPVTFATIPYAYARIYGGLKVQPSTTPGRRYDLVTTAYYQVSAAPAYVVDYFVTRDGGGSFQNSQALGEAYISQTPHSETALVGVNASTWLAFARGNDDISLKYSTDARKTWSTWETISWTSTGVHVAPDAIAVRAASGAPHIFLAVTDRTNDYVEFSAASVRDILNHGEEALSPPVSGQSCSNAYPGLIDFGDGQALFTFTREYTGQVYASWHLGQVNYGSIVNQAPGFKIGISASVSAPAGASKISWNNWAYQHGVALDNGEIVIRRAGPWRLTFCATFTTGIVDQALYYGSIYRNGSAIAHGNYHSASGVGTQSLTVTVEDYFDFGDKVRTDMVLAGAGAKNVVSPISQTWFAGAFLGD